MGLDITGYHTGHVYGAGYGGLHEIRALAVQVSGKFPTWNTAWEWLMITAKEDELYQENYYDFLEREELLEFRQLLHFSDAEGMLLKQYYLDGIDYKRSFSLGSLDELYQELERIGRHVESINDAQDFIINERTERLFLMLYNQVKDEYEEGCMLKFH